jgi:hypothetical protein
MSKAGTPTCARTVAASRPRRRRTTSKTRPSQPPSTAIVNSTDEFESIVNAVDDRGEIVRSVDDGVTDLYAGSQPLRERHTMPTSAFMANASRAPHESGQASSRLRS